MSSGSFARCIEASDGIAVAALASIARHNIEVSVLAFVTIASDDIWLAATVARQLVANRNAVVGLFGARWIACALLAITVRQSKRIAKVARQALFAVRSIRVVDTFQAIAGGAIAVAHSVRVDVAIAIARLTQLNGAKEAGRITVVAIRAEFTTRSCKVRAKIPLEMDSNENRNVERTEIALRTLQADDRFVRHLQTGPVLWTRTPFTVVGRSTQRIPVESLRTLIARIAGSIVLANASSRFRVADLRVFVAIARNARHEWSTTGRTVTEAWRARFTELTQISFGTRTLFDPCGRLAGRTAICRLQFHVVQERFAQRRVRAANFDGRQIAQNRYESAR